MKNFVSLVTFLTTITFGGLLATSAEAKSIETASTSLAEQSQINNETANLVSISQLGDYPQGTLSPTDLLRNRDWAPPTAKGDHNTWNIPESNNSADNSLNQIIGVTGLAIGTGVIAYHLSRSNRPSLVNSLPYGNTDTLLLERVSPKLRQKLLRLVNNEQTVNRLLTGTMLRHGERSPNWLAEKVIYDLECDRL